MSSSVTWSQRKVHKEEFDEEETKIRKSLVEDNQALNLDIKRLEDKRTALWNEMVKSNNWDDHENNPLVKAIDREIESKTSQSVKVWSILREMRKV
jgi:hypothetical protein